MERTLRDCHNLEQLHGMGCRRLYPEFWSVGRDSVWQLRHVGELGMLGQLRYVGEFGDVGQLRYVGKFGHVGEFGDVGQSCNDHGRELDRAATMSDVPTQGRSETGRFGS